MSKWRWFLAILVIVFVAYLIISKVNPTWGGGIDYVVGGFLGSVKRGIEASPLWQQYDVWFSGAFFAGVMAILMWQGHNAYNKIRGVAVKSAVKEAGYQVVPTAQPIVISQASTPKPAASPEPIETKTEEA